MKEINYLIDNGDFEKLVLILEKEVAEANYSNINYLILSYISIGCINKALYLYNSIIQNLGDESSHWILMQLGRVLVKKNRIIELIDLLKFFEHTENIMINLVKNSLILEWHTKNNNFILGNSFIDLNTPWSQLFNNSACHVLKEIEYKNNIIRNKKINKYDENGYSRIGVSIDSLAFYGRFGHQLSEYLLIRIICDKYTIPLETPEWIGDYVFELNDCVNIYNRRTVKYNAEKILKIADRSSGLELNGLDFFSPGSPLKWDDEINNKVKEIFIFRPHVKNILDKLIKKIKAENNFIIAFHIRSGDRAETLSKTNSIDCYTNWLAENWVKYENAILYIASDNIEYIKAKFSEYSPYCLSNFEIEYSNLDWLYDFYVLCNSNILGISHSGFSLMASGLNNIENAKFLQPNSQTKNLIPFYPNNYDMTDFEPGKTNIL